MQASASTTVSRVILLTGEVEAPVLSDLLHAQNPALEIRTVIKAGDLAPACAAPVPGTRLISFCSPLIVPGALLSALPGPSFNFHPGPPERPGRYPSVFALYDNAPSFGVTVHEMIAKVDAGPIVAAEWFDLPPDSEVAALELRALSVLFSIFKRIAPFLAMNPSALPRIYVPWTGEKRTKAQCDVICRLTPDLDDDEIALRTRACGTFLRS